MSLLERYRQGTEFDSVGRFTLDEKRAKNKMARFQLVRLEDFLLLVTQAAVAAGCTSIDTVVEDERVLVTAPGVNLRVEQVARLEDYIFDSSPQTISYYLLGVAHNAITPHCVDEPTVWVEDGVLTFEALPKTPLDDVEGHLSRGLYHIDCPVVVNGVQMKTDPLHGEDRISLTEGYYSNLTLVRYGVVVGHKTFEYPLNFTAVVKENSLRMDASFADVVEDDAYQSVLARVKGEVNEELAAVASRHQPGGPDAEMLLKRLCQGLPDPAGKALRACPLFPLADRGEYVSCDALQEERQAGRHVLHYGQRLNLMMDVPVVLTENRAVNRALWTEFGQNQLESAEKTYRRMLQIRQNKKRWQNSPRPTELAPNNYLIRRKVEGRNWQAELGYLGPPGGESHVDILYQGKLLCTNALEEVPPGAAVVLNLEEVEIDEMWTRPTGRAYRSVMKDLTGRLEGLFNSMEVTKPEQLYPQLREHLLEAMRRDCFELPKVVRFAPLFETTEGEWLSLNDLANLERVAVAERSWTPQRLPHSLIPEKLVRYSPEVLSALKRHAWNVEDFRVTQERLEGLDRRLLEASARPTLVGLEERLPVRKSLRAEGLAGEIGLDFQRTSVEAEVTLLYQGAEFETVTFKVTSAVHGRGVVQYEKLTPNNDWSWFAKDGAYKELRVILRQEFRSLEEAAFYHEKTPPEIARKILYAYPQPVEKYRDRPLFDSTTPGRFYSLAQLEKELAEHPELLGGPLGVRLHDRLVVLRPPKGRGLQDALLVKALGRFRWGNAEEIAEKRKLRAGFHARPVHETIKVRQEASIRYPLTTCRGEVVVGIDPGRGFVKCYFGGRYICRKDGLLFPGCAAAVDSEELVLAEDFNDCSIPSKILDEVQALCEKGLLACAVARKEWLRNLAFDYVNTKRPSREFLEAFQELPLFEKQGGGRVSINGLRSGHERAFQYVPHTFDRSLGTRDTVARLTSGELVLTKKRFRLLPVNVESALIQREKDRQYLSTLPTVVPPEFELQRSFEGEGLQAQIALQQGASEVVGLDEEGNPLGVYSFNGLPVCGVIRGSTPGKRTAGGLPTADLTSKQKRQFKEWVDELYLEWAELLSHRGLTDDEHEYALFVLDRTKHELGSRQEHPQAAVAQTLWRIPLFLRVDGTWVSGEALAGTLGSKEEPLVISDSRWRAPASAPLCRPNSVQHEILRGVFGNESLQWFEAPPLVDPEQVKENVQRLVDWGVSPFAAVKRRIAGLAETASEMVEKAWKALPGEDATGPRTRAGRAAPAGRSKSSPPTKPPPAPKPTPEAVFLSEMKSEANILLGRERYNRSDGYFRTTELGSWLFGPPVYSSLVGPPANSSRGGAVFRFNQAHPSVRWLIHSEKKTEEKARRVARMLLVIHWVGLVNEQSPEFGDDHERKFLFGLSERMMQTFS